MLPKRGKRHGFCAVLARQAISTAYITRPGKQTPAFFIYKKANLVLTSLHDSVIPLSHHMNKTRPAGWSGRKNGWNKGRSAQAHRSDGGRTDQQGQDLLRLHARLFVAMTWRRGRGMGCGLFYYHPHPDTRRGFSSLIPVGGNANAPQDVRRVLPARWVGYIYIF
jgi:hypothetical protein